MINLVTGGAGFIGSHLCERLLDLGESVICLDNLSTGRFKNIERLSGRADFKFINHDILCPLPDIRPKRIYNLASPASPRAYIKNQLGSLRTNTLGTNNVLECGLKNKSRVLQASTSEVYGEALHHPQAEVHYGNVNPIGPRSCYSEAKRCAETFLKTYESELGLDIRIARIFNTYGPRMSDTDGRVIINFLRSALSGEELQIYGNGKQTRSFCYVDDVVQGIIDLMNSSYKGPVNIGSEEEISINELAEKVLSYTDGQSSIAYLEPMGDDPKRRRPDLALAKKVIDWSPQTSLKLGIQRTIKALKNDI